LTYDRQWAVLIGALLILDALVVYGSLNLAYVVRITSGLLAYSSTHDPVAYRWFTMASIPVWLAIFALLGLYRRDNLLGGLHEYQQALGACTSGIIVIIMVTFFWRNEVQISRGWLLLAWGLVCSLLVAERFLVRRAAYLLRRRGWLTARVLIAGANDQGCAIARQWLRNPTSGMAVVGFVDDFKPVGAPVTDGLQVLGRPSALNALAQQTGAHEVLVVSNAVAWETFEEIIARATSRNSYTVRLSPGFYETLATGVVVTNKTFVPLFTVDQARLVGADTLLKRLLDYGLGVPLTLLAAPFLALIALGLRLFRPGPVLDRYLTVGQGRAVFSMVKFHDPVAWVADGASFSPPSPSFPRRACSELGEGEEGLGGTGFWLERFLARSGLDKLPQLFNVLAGQMSIVGPRPRVLGAVGDEPHTASNFQTVRPGIIGPWVVSAAWASGDETQDELYYVRNWTIWLDLQILVQTVLSLFISAFRPQARQSRLRENTCTAENE
jgi:lipopolysaccharide/colanic/teichoic acid biosynthesis glycosyltransferase